jgi:hypothetical protein
VTIRLKLGGLFAENLFHALAKLQFGFGPRGVSIGKSFPDQVMNGGEDLLKPGGHIGDGFGGTGSRLRPRAVRFSWACHENEKSLTGRLRPDKKTPDFCGNAGSTRAHRSIADRSKVRS